MAQVKSTHDAMLEVFGEDVEMTPEIMMADASTDFAASALAVMREAGVTFTALARRLGVSQPTVSEKLSGDANLTLQSMAEIARALGCELAAPVVVAPESPNGTKVATFKLHSNRRPEPTLDYGVRPTFADSSYEVGAA